MPNPATTPSCSACSEPIPDPAALLVNRVAVIISHFAGEDATRAARAAICEVAAWIDEQDGPLADLLREQATHA